MAIVFLAEIVYGERTAPLRIHVFELRKEYRCPEIINTNA